MKVSTVLIAALLSTAAMSAFAGGTSTTMRVFSHLTVEDYAKWRSVFNTGEEMRNAAGFKNVKVYQNADNPNDVIVAADTSDVKKARAFFSSPELRTGMQKGGVTNPQTFWAN
jgi:hypothetical protein